MKGAKHEAIRTARLILRTPRAADASEIAVLLNDWDVIQQTAALPYPFTRRHALAWVRNDVEQMAADRILERRLILKAADDGPIGAIDLFERGEHPSVAYWLARTHWGQGFATEAAEAFVAHVFRSRDLPRLHAGIFIENAASGRVLEKIGFRPDGEYDIDAELRGGRRRVRTYVLERPQ